MKKETRYKLEYSLLRTLEVVLSPMSSSLRRRAAAWFGKFVWYVIPYRQKVVMNNLSHAFPDKSRRELKAIAKKCYIHFACLYLEMFASFKLPESSFNRQVKNPDQKIIDDILNRGKGMLLVMFHFGNWEVFGDWFTRRGYKASAVARRQHNPLVNDKIISTRLTNGGILYYMDEDTIKMMKMVKNNGILCLVADQDAGKNGVFVPFFGRLSSSFRGPALMAKRLKCPLLAATSLKQPDGTFEIRVHEIDTASEKTVEEIIADYTAYFESLIRRYPEQYYWFHRRWKTQPLTQ